MLHITWELDYVLFCITFVLTILNIAQKQGWCPVFEMFGYGQAIEDTSGGQVLWATRVDDRDLFTVSVV